MPTSVRTDGVYPGTSKFLYTAVLYDNVPESSTSSTGEVGPNSTYLKRLMREHLARASMEEVTSSEFDAPAPESEARVVQLAEKVRRAFLESNGNPADGRWAVISDLLRLHSTRGGRNWIGVNLDVGAPEIPKHLCEMSRTSEEWQKLEQRLKGAEEVKFKVQKWIAVAEFEPLAPDTTIVHYPLTSRASLSLDPAHFQEKHKGLKVMESPVQKAIKTVSSGFDPLSSGSKFGFNVVKRPIALIKDKPKPKAALPLPLHPPAPAESPAPPGFQEEARSSATPSNGQSQPSILNLSNIADAPDSSLHPPSFRLSQIRTSTPTRNLRNLPPEEGLMLSSPNHKSLPNAKHAFSQHRGFSASPVPEHPRKREGSQLLEDAHRAKKPRTAVDNYSLLQSSSSQFGTTDIPATPRGNSPPLAELLSSSTHNAFDTPKKRCSNIAYDLPSSSTSSELNDQPPSSTAPEVSRADGSAAMLDAHDASPRLLAPESRYTIQTTNTAFDEKWRSLGHDPEPSSEPALTSNAFETAAPDISPAKDAIVERPPSQWDFKSPVLVESHVDADISIEQALIAQESPPHTPTPTSPLRFPSNGPESLSPDAQTTTYNLYGLDDLDSSPVKSLSSLAGSDSGSDEIDGSTAENVSLSECIHTVDVDFNPQFTSTQKLDLCYPSALNVPMISDSQGSGNEKLPSMSQLQAEVNNQVNKFDKFLEADLGYDFIPPGQ